MSAGEKTGRSKERKEKKNRENKSKLWCFIMHHWHISDYVCFWAATTCVKEIFCWHHTSRHGKSYRWVRCKGGFTLGEQITSSIGLTFNFASKYENHQWKLLVFWMVYANTLCLGSIFISISVYVTERDDWYLYDKELLEYDQYSAWLLIT